MTITGVSCRISRGSSPAQTLRTIFQLSDPPMVGRPWVITSWDDDPDYWEPFSAGQPSRNHLRRLAQALMEPARLAALSPTKFVFHATLRMDPARSPPTDPQWAQLATTIMDATGVHPLGDDNACRWVSLRSTSHVTHVVATLARHDRGPITLTGTTGLTS